jgi:hypothetical protein
MPLALNPQRVADVSLRLDQSVPATERPAFLFKFLTKAEYEKVDGILSAAPSDDAGFLKAMKEAIAIGLRGWRNIVVDGQPVPFDAATAIDKLDELLTPDELVELGTGFRLALSLSEQDLKKSASQSSTATAKSAGETASTQAEPPAVATVQP